MSFSLQNTKWKPYLGSFHSEVIAAYVVSLAERMIKEGTFPLCARNRYVSSCRSISNTSARTIISTSSTETNTVMTNTSIKEEKDVQNRGTSDREIPTAANERTPNVSAAVVEGTVKKARRSTPRKKLRRKKDEVHSSHDNHKSDFQHHGYF